MTGLKRDISRAKRDSECLHSKSLLAFCFSHDELAWDTDDYRAFPRPFIHLLKSKQRCRKHHLQRDVRANHDVHPYLRGSVTKRVQETRGNRIYLHSE